ncbi:hypothetical protein FNV43_RR02114 [Rhamnella rubrinervis]|uniref:Uncharacterized protein n=1 Tax=Rhamnella rubrinervis TaxID=2594499 RepID=A0A8K0HQW2_9ROSA|nr:hypothetical protein FNV43_RR02114 [Rhamnella rubrinervis]
MKWGVGVDPFTILIGLAPILCSSLFVRSENVFRMFGELDMWCTTGETTILKILRGKHTVEPHIVRVLMSRSAFHDTTLTTSGDICYLGGEWRQNVAFAGFEVPVQMDISAEKMIFGVGWIDPQRRSELIKILIYDGGCTKYPVQICMDLLKLFKVLLLDEITVDLDVLARVDLLKFLRKECEERGATIIYATHIFDGLEEWPSLTRTVESWLRKERDEERKRRKERKARGLPEFEEQKEGSHVTEDQEGFTPLLLEKTTSSSAPTEFSDSRSRLQNSISTP